MEDAVNTLLDFAVSYGIAVILIVLLGSWFFRLMKKDIEKIDEDKKP